MNENIQALVKACKEYLEASLESEGDDAIIAGAIVEFAGAIVEFAGRASVNELIVFAEMLSDNR